MAVIDKPRRRYQTFGPFRLEWNYKSGEKSFKAALTSFWNDRKQAGLESLSMGVGVYVWTHEEDGKRLPWNVGLTNQQGFKSRFRQKEKTFLKLALEQRATDIEVYLLALMTPSGKFRKPTESEKIGSNIWLENLLLGAALTVNPALRNSANLAMQKTLIVDGYLNDKGVQRSSSAESFAKLFQR